LQSLLRLAPVVDAIQVEDPVQVIRLSSVVLTSPVLNLTRDRSGQLNLLPAGPPIAIKIIAADALPAGAGGQNNAPNLASSAPATPGAAPPAPGRTTWKVQVASLAVRSGMVNWLDQSLASPARIRLNGLVLDASAIGFPFSAGAPLQFKGAIAVTGDAMRELALRRSVAIKDYLASRDLAPARPFLGAARTVPPDAKRTPRAELNLAMP